MKKLIATLCLLCVFSFSVAAFEITQLTPGDEFILYSEDAAGVAKALNTDESDLTETVIENGIIFLAVNEKNTKQIQLSCNETEFSNSVSNLTNLSNDSISALLPNITGMENVKGEVVYKDSQKYVKINLRNSESGNEYILTQYFTVMDKKLYTLSFYTDANENTDYVEKTFITTAKDETEIKPGKDLKLVRIFVVSATVIFGAVCLVLLYTIIKDLIVAKKKEIPETNE